MTDGACSIDELKAARAVAAKKADKAYRKHLRHTQSVADLEKMISAAEDLPREPTYRHAAVRFMYGEGDQSQVVLARRTLDGRWKADNTSLIVSWKELIERQQGGELYELVHLKRLL